MGFYADGYTFQYWNGKTDPSAASLLSGAADHLNIDAALAPIDTSPPAGSGPPTDSSPPASSGPPSDGTPPAGPPSDGTGSSGSPTDATAPAGSGAPTDRTTGAGAAVADDRAIAMGLITPPLEATWSDLSTA